MSLSSRVLLPHSVRGLATTAERSGMPVTTQLSFELLAHFGPEFQLLTPHGGSEVAMSDSDICDAACTDAHRASTESSKLLIKRIVRTLFAESATRRTTPSGMMTYNKY